jgi:hypothetical protein
MNWTIPYLEEMNIMQLKELKSHINKILDEKNKQAKRNKDERLAKRV